MTDQCGTPVYIAPEILLNNGYYGFGVDIWSAGVVLYTMLSGVQPFNAKKIDDLHDLIINGIFTSIKTVSEGKVNYTPNLNNILNIILDANDLLRKILEVNPKKRYTSSQILNHRWMSIEDGNGKVKSKSNQYLLLMLYYLFNSLNQLIIKYLL